MEGSQDSESVRELNTRHHTLTLCTRLAYSVGHVLNDLCASMWFTYLLVYLHFVLNFNNTLSGALLLVGQIADALATPFVGIQSDKQDNFWLCQYGRRKTWHLIGTICVAVCFPFIFMKCISCENSHQYAQFIYYSAFIAIFQFGWAATQISHLSLIADLTPISSERVELNSLRYAFTVASNICVYSITWIVLGVSSSQDRHIKSDDYLSFQHIVLSVVSIGIFFSIIFHLFVKEPSTPLMLSSFEDSTNLQHSTEPHLTWKDWFKFSLFYKIALLYMATRLYVNLSQVYMPLYLQDTLLLDKKSIAFIPMMIYVSGFVFSFVAKYLNKWFGNKVSYLLGCILALAAAFYLYFGRGSNYNSIGIYIVAVMVGAAGSTMLIISLSFTSDLIGNNTSSGAFVFGAMSFLDKLSNGLAVIVIQDAHPCITCCDDCKWYYQYVLVYACGGAVLLGLLALSLLAPYPLVVEKPGIANVGSQPRYNDSDPEDEPLLGSSDAIQNGKI